MLYLKENPQGLDISIHKIQKKLYSLADKWGVELEGYPRCFTNIKNKAKIIEFNQSGKDYKSLIFAEKNKFFFLAENEIKRETQDFYLTKVDLFFILDAKKCKPTITHWPDEEVRKDVLNILGNCNINIDFTIQTNPQSVFNGYSFKDNEFMYPVCCFKISFTVNYSINQKLC